MTTKRATKRATEMGPLATQNVAWGFYGTMRSDLGANAGVQSADEWAAERYAAMGRILIGLGITPAQAREYLDARHGRHLADYYDGAHPDEKTAPSWLRDDIRRFFGRNVFAGERAEQHASVNFRMPGTGWTDEAVAERVAEALRASGIEVTAIEVNREG